MSTGEAQRHHRHHRDALGYGQSRGRGNDVLLRLHQRSGLPDAIANGAANPEAGEATYQKELAEGAPSPYAEGETTAPITPSQATDTDGRPDPLQRPAAGRNLPLRARCEQRVRQTVGRDETFRTATGTPPIVSTGGASASARTRRRSQARSHEQPADRVRLRNRHRPGNYGPATGLGSIGGAATETVSVTLGELQPGTTYYYRIEATNADGTSHGEPQAFTTPGFPTLIATPASPPLIGTPSIAFPKEEKAQRARRPRR